MGERNSLPFTTSSSSAGGIPYLRPKTNASPIASIAAASRKLPASLITLARAGSSPAASVPWPIASNNGRQRSIAAAGAVVHAELVARLQQAARQRQPHAAETDESHSHATSNVKFTLGTIAKQRS